MATGRLTKPFITAHAGMGVYDENAQAMNKIVFLRYFMEECPTLSEAKNTEEPPANLAVYVDELGVLFQDDDDKFIDTFIEGLGPERADDLVRKSIAHDLYFARNKGHSFTGFLLTRKPELLSHELYAEILELGSGKHTVTRPKNYDDFFLEVAEYHFLKAHGKWPHDVIEAGSKPEDGAIPA